MCIISIGNDNIQSNLLMSSNKFCMLTVVSSFLISYTNFKDSLYGIITDSLYVHKMGIKITE